MGLTPSQLIDQLFDKKMDRLREQKNELKRMADDPEMLELMREVVTASLNAPPAPVHAAPNKKQKTGLTPNGNKWAANGLSDAVLDAIRARKRFTLPQIVGDLKTSGFHFVAKNPRVAAHKVVEKLAEKDVIKIAAHGTGNTPHTWEYVSG